MPAQGQQKAKDASTTTTPGPSSEAPETRSGEDNSDRAAQLSQAPATDPTPTLSNAAAPQPEQDLPAAARTLFGRCKAAGAAGGLLQTEARAVLQKAWKGLEMNQIMKGDGALAADSNVRAMTDLTNFVQGGIDAVRGLEEHAGVQTFDDALAKLRQAILALNPDSLPHCNPWGELQKVAEGLANQNRNLRELETRVDDVLLAIKQGKRQAEKDLPPLLEVAKNATGDAQAFGTAKKKLTDALLPFEAAVQKQATPDARLIRDMTLKTLTALVDSKAVRQGRITSAYHTSSDTHGGYSVAISVENLNRFEIHCHCTAEGEIASGPSPVHIKRKTHGGKYTPGSGLTLDASLQTALLPDAATRRGWKPGA